MHLILTQICFSPSPIIVFAFFYISIHIVSCVTQIRGHKGA